MKRMMIIAAALGILAVLLGFAKAAPAIDPGVPVSDAYPWEALVTMGGATVITLVVVQYLKAPVDKFLKIPTRLLVYVIAAGVMVAANVFTARVAGGGDVLLILLNGVPVAFAAMGAHEVTFSKVDQAAQGVGRPPGE